MLQPAELTNTMVEVHDIIAGFELRQAFQCDGAAKSPLPAQAAPPPKDFVVGEDACGRIRALQHEASADRADRDVRAWRGSGALGQLDELFQALELSGVVA